MGLMAVAGLCALIWLLVFVYLIARRGFTVLLLWLLVGPIMLNVIERPLSNPLFGQVAKKSVAQVVDAEDRTKKQTTVARSLDAPVASIRIAEALNPTRTLFVLFLAVFVLEALMRGKRPVQLDWTETWMIIFSLILITSAVLQSRRMANSLRVAVDSFIVPFAAYYITRRLVSSADDYRRLITVMTYLGLYVVFVVFLERLSVPGLLYRVSGPFQTDNQLYALMITIFFLLLGEALPRRGKESCGLSHYLRWALIGAVPLIIFVTWARSNWLGFFVGVWVFLFFARRLVSISQRIAVIGLILLLVPVMGFGVQALTSDERIEGRVTRTSSIFARLAAWQIVTQKGLENPLTGIGFKNAEAVLLTERSYLNGVKNETDAHNGFLTIFAEHGFPGLVVYGAVISSMFLFGLNLYRKGTSSQDRWRGVCITALVAGYMTPVLTTTILQVPSLCHSYIFACLGGLAGVYKHNWQKTVSVLPRTVLPRYAKDQHLLSS
jgi:O-antigen ligase